MSLDSLFQNIPILIKGGGDLATGVAARLFHVGFPVVITEHPTPMMVRRAVSFGAAITEGSITVEDITAKKSTAADVRSNLEQGFIPVVVDPTASIAQQWQPVVLIDAIMAKRNTGTRITDAPVVIALGPGFYAGRDCHIVIETNRGHRLGRIIRAGTAQPNTNIPGAVKDITKGRVLRAPAEGHLTPYAVIGDLVKGGDLIATINGQPVVAPFDGVLRGLIHPTVPLTPGFKIGDVDPRGNKDYCFSISEKSLAIGGGVLEAILANDIVKQKLLRST